MTLAPRTYVPALLKLYFGQKFYDRYGNLIKQYEVPFPNVTWHPGWPYAVTSSTLQTLHQLMTFFSNLTLLPNLIFYIIARGFHRTLAKGGTYQQRMLTSLDTWSYPTLGFTGLLMLRPISPELSTFFAGQEIFQE